MVDVLLQLAVEMRQSALQFLEALFHLSALLQVFLDVRQQFNEVQQRQQRIMLIAHPREVVLQHLQPSEEPAVRGPSAGKMQLRVHNKTSS